MRQFRTALAFLFALANLGISAGPQPSAGHVTTARTHDLAARNPVIAEAPTARHQLEVRSTPAKGGAGGSGGPDGGSEGQAPVRTKYPNHAGNNFGGATARKNKRLQRGREVDAALEASRKSSRNAFPGVPMVRPPASFGPFGFSPRPGEPALPSPYTHRAVTSPLQSSSSPSLATFSFAPPPRQVFVQPSPPCQSYHSPQHQQFPNLPISPGVPNRSPSRSPSPGAVQTLVDSWLSVPESTPPASPSTTH